MRVISSQEVEKVAGGWFNFLLVVVIGWAVSKYGHTAEGGCISTDPTYCGGGGDNGDGTD